MPRWFKWIRIALGVGLAVAVAGVLVGRRQPPLPSPNGHDRLLALAAQIPADVSDLDEKGGVTTGQFAAAHSNLVTEVQRALDLPALVPVAYTSSWIGGRMPELMSLRRLGKAVLACARHSASQADLMAATGARLATIKLGQQGTRGGLLIDFMVGSAMQINGLTHLSNSLPRTESASCKIALDGLLALQASQESLSAYVARERRWMFVGSEWWQDWRTAKDLPQG